MAYPDFGKNFVLQTDASDYGVGAVLSQLDDSGNEKVIAYASKALSPRKQKYSTTEKEALAVVFGTGHFRVYLLGRNFKLITDHNALRWLHTMDGVASTWSPVTSGVPQGSILGPLLFVIFINDLPDFTVKGTETALYADDTKLHDTITSTNDCERLQQSLTNLDHWSVQNNIRFNPSKCKVLTISRKKSPITYDYTLGTVKLIRVCNEKDLGVIASYELSWDLHINSIISKANKMLGVLKRTSTHASNKYKN